MNNRPRSITVISWVFIVFGCLGLLAELVPAARHSGPPTELALVYLARVAAAVAGAFMLRGRNWARWLLVAWLVYHVALSVLHPPMELVIHCLFLAVGLFILFRPPASAFFRREVNGSPAT